MNGVEQVIEISTEAIIRALRSHYRSGEADLGRDFFTPCLSHCAAYRRAVGFFSSSSLITWSAILPRLAEPNKVQVKLLIGPYLSESDCEAMRQALSPDSRERLRQEVADRIIQEVIEPVLSKYSSEMGIADFIAPISTMI